jgi:phosphoserine phosphatase RsbU/P
LRSGGASGRSNRCGRSPRRSAEHSNQSASPKTFYSTPRRGEVWLVEREGLGIGARLSGAQAVGPCENGACTVAARIGGAILTAEEASHLPEVGLVEDGRLAVPVSGRSGRLAVLALAEREVRGGTTPFGPTDAETLALFAAQAAVALENAHLYSEELERQRLERELELAAAIQRQLLPREFPVMSGAAVAARTEASSHVGGDLYGLIPTSAGTVLVLADISGKGIPAALMAASLHAAIRILAQSGAPPLELAMGLHAHLLAATPDNKFATAFLARLSSDGWLDYVSAGHNPALLMDRGGRIEYLGATGTPLGLLPDAHYESARVQLFEGSTLVAYTDGFTEAPGPNGDDFGLDRLAAVVAASRGQSPQQTLDALFAAVSAYTAGAPPHDDRTALVLRRTSA